MTDQEQIDAIAELCKDPAAVIEFKTTKFQAWILLGLIQRASNHPRAGQDESLREAAKIGRLIQDAVATTPTLQAMAIKGWQVDQPEPLPQAAMRELRELLLCSSLHERGELASTIFYDLLLDTDEDMLRSGLKVDAGAGEIYVLAGRGEGAKSIAAIMRHLAQQGVLSMQQPVTPPPASREN